MRHPFALFTALLLSWISCNGAAKAQAPIKIGYVPNLWCFHGTVLVEEKWDAQAGLKIALQQFPGPPTLTQAFAAGQLDAMYNNTSSILPLVERGIPIVMVASTIRDDIYLVAKPPLLDLVKDRTPLEAIRAYKEKFGKRVKITTNPKGTLTDLILKKWFKRELPDWEKWVELINAGSQDQLQQSVFSPDVNASTLWGELLEVSQAKDPRLGVFAGPEVLMPHQPGGMLIIRKSFAEAHPEVVEKLVQLQVRAFDWIKQNPEHAAKHYSKYIGHGLVSVAQVAAAIRRLEPRWVVDPAPMLTPAQEIADLMKDLGYLRQPLDLKKLWDTSYYQKAQAH